MNGYFSPIPTLSPLGAWASVSVVDGIEAGVSALRRPHDGLTDRHTPTRHTPTATRQLPLSSPRCSFPLLSFFLCFFFSLTDLLLKKGQMGEY